MTKFKALLLKTDEAQDNVANRDWWEKNPMTYDWEGRFGKPEPSSEYFQTIDRVFGEAHRLLNNPRWPNGFILDNFLPYDDFSGRSVLEIGCGAGLVASHIAAAGASLTAIDLTEQSIALTKRRFQLGSLSGQIIQMNAEKMSFPDQSFDYVVSWGVIHHSGNMRAILDNIHRVLKPGGKAYLMIYNRNSLRYQIYCRFWLGIICGRLFGRSLPEIAGSITDGHIARHLTPGELNEATKRFSRVDITTSDEKTTILKYLCGIGLPFRYISGLTRPLEKWLARRWGWYLQAALTK